MYLVLLSCLFGVTIAAKQNVARQIRYVNEPIYRQDLPPIPPDTSVPLPQTTPIPIISYSFQPNNGDGSYAWSYESGNGIKAEESGSQKELGQNEDGPIYGNAAKGSYSYKSDNGETIAVVYTADENGFQPSGDHLPTPPPPNEEIYQALQAAAEYQRSRGLPISPVYTFFLRHARRHYHY